MTLSWNSQNQKKPLLSKHECALWTPCTMQFLKEKICKVSFRIYALAETSFEIVFCRAFLMKTLKHECWIHTCPKLLYYRVRPKKPRPNQPCDYRWKNIPRKSNFSSAIIKTGNRHLTSLKNFKLGQKSRFKRWCFQKRPTRYANYVISVFFWENVQHPHVFIFLRIKAQLSSDANIPRWFRHCILVE